MEDVFLVTMLNANIDDIKTQCLSNKTAYNHCSHNDFWIQKFNHDHLPLINENNLSINEWIKLYKLMQKYKYKAQDILLIHKIESERVIDPLYIIKLAINDNVFHLFKEMYKDKIPHFDHIYDIDISINKSLYDVSYNQIELETGELVQIKQSMSYNQVLNLIISVLYVEPNSEILDQMSNYFMIDENDNIDRWDNDSKRIAYKRMGIRNAIQYI